MSLRMRLIIRLHKRNYDLKTGDCSTDPSMHILTFEVKEEAGTLLVKLPPAEELDEMIGSSKCKFSPLGLKQMSRAD